MGENRTDDAADAVLLAGEQELAQSYCTFDPSNGLTDLHRED